MKLATSCAVICLIYALTGPSLCKEHGKHLRRHLKTQRYALDWHARSSRSTDSCPEEDDLSEDDKCPSGWTKNSASCYYKGDGKKTWEDARNDCRQKGSDLITITSQAELTFAEGFIGTRSVWLGLFDKLKDGKFVWSSSGEQPSFTKWWTGEPDGTNPNHDCVFDVLGNGWLNKECTETDYYICEIPLDDDSR